MGSSLRDMDYSVVQQCMHCGMCLPTCPTYVQTLQEKNSPRGRIALMRAVADGRLEISREFAEEMYYCLGCLACMTACPAGVDYAGLFEVARSESEAKRVLDSPLRRVVRGITLRFLFLKQSRLRLVAKLLYLYQASGMQALVRKAGLTRLLPGTLRELEPMTPTIQARDSDRLIAEVERPSGPVRHRVVVLTGCVQDVAFSDVNRDTVDVLLANGCEVRTPRSQGCCGSLHAHNGELGLARDLARGWIDRLLPENGVDEPEAIIINAAGCGSHLKHFAVLLADDHRYRERARKWDRLVRDALEFLAEIGCRRPESGGPEPRKRLTYHEACHLVHGQKISRQPREILQMLPGFDWVELPESAWCCGSAGVYNITQPESSAVLLERKMGHIASVRPEVVATSNPGCLLQIQNGARQRGMELRIAHPLTLLAEAYRAESTGKKTSGKG
jgi:glycolate oxidase iron-sulfur subunit